MIGSSEYATEDPGRSAADQGNFLTISILLTSGWLDNSRTATGNVTTLARQPIKLFWPDFLCDSEYNRQENAVDKQGFQHAQWGCFWIDSAELIDVVIKGMFQCHSSLLTNGWLGSFGQLGPDAGPFFWQQVPSCNQSAGCLLYGDGKGRCTSAIAIGNVLNMATAGTTLLCEVIASSYIKTRKMGFELHTSLHHLMLFKSTLFDVLEDVRLEHGCQT